jgi:uncharacterized protein YfkK (UPF0435 family)
MTEKEKQQKKKQLLKEIYEELKVLNATAIPPQDFTVSSTDEPRIV